MMDSWRLTIWFRSVALCSIIFCSCALDWTWMLLVSTVTSLILSTDSICLSLKTARVWFASWMVPSMLLILSSVSFNFSSMVLTISFLRSEMALALAATLASISSFALLAVCCLSASTFLTSSDWVSLARCRSADDVVLRIQVSELILLLVLGNIVELLFSTGVPWSCTEENHLVVPVQVGLLV